MLLFPGLGSPLSQLVSLCDFKFGLLYFGGRCLLGNVVANFKRVARHFLNPFLQRPSFLEKCYVGVYACVLFALFLKTSVFVLTFSGICATMQPDLMKLEQYKAKKNIGFCARMLRMADAKKYTCTHFDVCCVLDTAVYHALQKMSNGNCEVAQFSSWRNFGAKGSFQESGAC